MNARLILSTLAGMVLLAAAFWCAINHFALLGGVCIVLSTIPVGVSYRMLAQLMRKAYVERYHDSYFAFQDDRVLMIRSIASLTSGIALVGGAVWFAYKDQLAIAGVMMFTEVVLGALFMKYMSKVFRQIAYQLEMNKR